MVNVLQLVYDNNLGSEAIYIDGFLRAEFGEKEMNTAELIECYHNFIGEDKPAMIVYAEIDSDELGIVATGGGDVDWPEEVEGLKLNLSKAK